MTETRERWWHLLAGVEDELNATVRLVLGEATEHPEHLVARLDEGTLTLTAFEVELAYVRSWNREPSDDELDEAIEGFRQIGTPPSA